MKLNSHTKAIAQILIIWALLAFIYILINCFAYD